MMLILGVIMVVTITGALLIVWCSDNLPNWLGALLILALFLFILSILIYWFTNPGAHHV